MAPVFNGMQFKPPKNDDKYRWTNHVKGKMVYYGISEGLIKRIVRFPKRKEIGIAENTVAVMQPTSNPKKPQEVWVMYQEIDQKSNLKNQNYKPKFKIYQKPSFDYQHPKVRVISAWRYPGVSPVGKKIPIPDEILQELENLVQ